MKSTAYRFGLPIPEGLNVIEQWNGANDFGVFCLSPQKGIVGIRVEGLTGNHRPMKRFFQEVEAIWRRRLRRRSQKAGMFMPRFLGLLRRFPLPEPTILNPYRSVIQELTKNLHESRGSSDVKLYLFAGIGKKTQVGRKPKGFSLRGSHKAKPS
jgi:hypothetical protein